MCEVKLPGFSYTFSFAIENYLRMARSINEIHRTMTLKNDCNYCEGDSDSSAMNYPHIHFCEFKLIQEEKHSLSSTFYALVRCGENLKYYELCFTYSIVNKEKECYVERNCDSDVIQIRGNDAKIGISNFLNRRTLIEDLLLEPSNTIEILCEVSFLEKSAISTIRKHNEIIENTPNQVDSPISDLSNDFKTFYENQKCCDVKLISRDKKELKAHKAILAARSSVFCNMFEHNMKEQNDNVVEIEDFDHDILKATLQYIYTGKMEKLGELCGEVLPVAEKYNIEALKTECEKVLIQNLAVDNSAQILILSDMCNSNNLKMAVENFIISNGHAVARTNEFEELKKSHPNLLVGMFCKMLEKM